PTIRSRDGVHPSFPSAYRNDYSDEGLSKSGYTLRNYLTLLAYAEVIDVLQDRKESSPVSGQGSKGQAAIPLQVPKQPWFPKAPPLPQPKEAVVRVATADELYHAAEAAKPGTTILLADGVYRLSRPLD